MPEAQPLASALDDLRARSALVVGRLSSLSLRRLLIYGAALVASVCEGMLQTQAHVGAGAIGASAVVLFVAAAATHFAVQRVEELLARLVAEQVQLQLESAHSAE